MDMKKLTWVEQIYQYVEFYYWEPQHLGKKTPPGKGGKENFEKFKKSLKNQEVPLNTLFNLTFHLLPNKLKQKVLLNFKNLKFNDVQILNNESIGDVKGVLQPDVTIKSNEYKGFIELKVDAPLHLDQIYKYILGHAKWNINAKPFLFLLTKKDIVKQWKPDERDKIFKNNNIDDLLAYLKNNSIPESLGGINIASDHSEMKKIINSLELGWNSWNKLNNLLKEFSNLEEYKNNETLQILIKDFIAELNERGFN